MAPTGWRVIQNHLRAEGLMSDTGLTRKPRHRHCKQGCGLILLAGMDDLGRDTWCWPHPTTVPGELAALMGGERTLTICDGELVCRDVRRIGWKDADREATYVTHTCGATPPPVNEMHVKKVRHQLPVNAPAPF